MEWNRLYGKDRKPTLEEAGTFAGGLLSGDFMGFMAENCPAAPKLEYSGCTMQPGWNIKFKKNGKNVCTLYPLDGYFICMILIGGDAMAEMEARLGDFTPVSYTHLPIPDVEAGAFCRGGEKKRLWVRRPYVTILLECNRPLARPDSRKWRWFCWNTGRLRRKMPGKSTDWCRLRSRPFTRDIIPRRWWISSCLLYTSRCV